MRVIQVPLPYVQPGAKVEALSFKAKVGGRADGLTRGEVRLHPEEPERITWQKQLLKQEWNLCHCNVWRNEDPNKMDYALRNHSKQGIKRQA